MDAARRQLDTAIRLWFEGGDPVAIHTLALASHDIIHHLFRRKGFSGLMFDAEMIRPEYRQQWATSLKAAANFFKHGRHDENKTLEFDPLINEYVLMASASGLSRMGEEPSMEQLALGYWTLYSRPYLFEHADREAWLNNPKIKALQDFAANGPKLFLEGFERAWAAGHIRC